VTGILAKYYHFQPDAIWEMTREDLAHWMEQVKEQQKDVK
jgi:hypothetical protein